jgi:hypothetical protein
MNGLDPLIDLTFLLDVPLHQVCVGEHQVQLNFADHVSIAIESDVHQRNGSDGGWLDFTAAADWGRAAIALLNLTATSVLGQENGTLTITWSDGSVTRIDDSNQHYESYQIHNGPQIIVV